MKKFMKKLLILTVIAAMVVASAPLSNIDFSDFILPEVKAATETFTWGDYECIIINKNEVKLVKYYGTDTEVTIPSEINGMPVTSIGEGCFNGKYSYEAYSAKPHPNAENNNKITKITVPSSVKTICIKAFGSMENLNELVLNEGLEVIYEWAFDACPKLCELDLPNSLVTFPFNAVDNTPITELIFGTNVKHINIETSKYSYVKRMVFNADVITIENITLEPDKCVLDEIVCNGQLELDTYFKITNKGTVGKIVCSSDTSWGTICDMGYEDMIAYFNDPDGIIVFSEDEILLNNEHETNGFRYFLNNKSEAIISRYTGGESVVVVPESLDGYPVTQIGSYALSAFVVPETLITSINLPETIESIAKNAFEYNEKLTQINIPSKVTTIPFDCFRGCDSLEYIEIPDTVNKIEGGAFRYCEGLKSISLPESVTEISEGTFMICSSLESIDMPCVRKIGYRAFSNCYSLVITELPDCLTEIGSEAFQGCDSLERLDLSKVTHFGEYVMNDCINLKEVILNDNLERLEKGLFFSCDKLEKVVLPSNLVYIGEDCFRGSGLKSITFNEGLKTIDRWAFGACTKLSEVVFPESLEYIWNIAFDECDALESITLPVNLKILGFQSFARCDKLTTIYFNALNCRVCDANKYNDKGYIPGNWALASPFYKTNITNIVFGKAITTISSDSGTNGTFEGHDTLETIAIPDTVEEIGTAAFKNCSSLETAVISDGVTEIADDAFDGCNKLTIYCTSGSYVEAYALDNNIKVSTLVIAPIPNQTYTGKEIKPSISVSYSDESLDKTDYTVSYSNNINVGTAKVSVTGTGYFKYLTSKAGFEIISRKISDAVISEISDRQYTGNEITPEISIVYNGITLKKGIDYTVSYSNNTEVGTADVTVKGIGNFKGDANVNFEIVEKGGQSSDNPPVEQPPANNDQTIFDRIIEFLTNSIRTIISSLSFIWNLVFSF